MKSPHARADAGPQRRGWLLLALILMPCALVTVLVTGCFSLSLSRDAAVLRQSVIENSAGSWDQQIEIGVGAIPFYVARFALQFVEIPPEARAALQSIKSAEVGVYQLHRNGTERHFGEILDAADAAMSERGWERMVAVASWHNCVAVYVAKNLKSSGNVRVHLVVMDGRQMVVASGKANLAPLAEFAQRQMASISGTEYY